MYILPAALGILHVFCDVIRDWSLIMGRGGGGGQVKFYPYGKGRGIGRIFFKGGRFKCYFLKRLFLH